MIKFRSNAGIFEDENQKIKQKAIYTNNVNL